jgi:hypothetical protein
MPTAFQEKTIEKSLREYRKKYLSRKENLDADEATARIMINNFLSQVLGYAETIDISTEYMIKGTYADYVVKLDKKIQFIVEAKAVSIDLNSHHLKQAVDYAANEGIDWVILMNGRQIELHRVLFEKPIRSQKIFEFDLTNLSTLRAAAKNISYLSKPSVTKGELENYWKRFDALTDVNLRKALHSPEVIRALRLQIRRKSGINFADSEITKSLDAILRLS